MALRHKLSKRKNAGFTLLELMVATLLFVVITGVVFAVVIATQVRYQAEKEYMGAFQQANVAIDQIARDIHGAGFPAKIIYNSSFQSTTSNRTKWAVPVSWNPNYPNTPCVIGSTCTTPGSYDLILEEDLADGNGVVWIRYQLSGNTLKRAVVAKTTADPKTATDALLIPYLERHDHCIVSRHLPWWCCSSRFHVSDVSGRSTSPSEYSQHQYLPDRPGA